MGMKQILVMIAVVVLVGCGSTKVEPPQASEAEPQVVSKPTPVSPADEKLIADPIVEKAVRKKLKRPEGKLTEADLKKVTHLDLRGTKILGATEITDEGLKEVAKLQQLTSLNLRDNTKITNTGLKEVAKLEKLTWLHLSNTVITNADLKELAKLQKLKSLNLNSTQITDAGLKELAKLQKLELLFLNSTKVTKAGVAELKKALPNCEILGP